MDLKEIINRFYWIIALVAIISVFILGRCSGNSNKEVITETKVKRDTAYIVKTSEPVVIKKMVPKLVYKKDTVILTKPFTALVDTIIKKDTIKASYEFPENNFSLLIKQKPDSMMVNTITMTKEKVKEKPWWETPVYILGGVIVGVIIGHTVK